MDKHPAMLLRKTYLFPKHLSIMMTSFLINPPEPSMNVPSSSPYNSNANGKTVSGKPPPLIPFLILSAKTPTPPGPAELLLMDFFLKEGRITVKTVHIFPLKQP